MWDWELGLSATGADLDRVHPDDRDELQRRLDAHRARPAHPCVAEFRLQDADGQWRWVFGRGSIVASSDGKGDRLLGLLTDIDASHNERKALELSRARFQAIYETTPDSMGITRIADGRYLDVNSGFERLSGYSRAETIGRTSTELGIWESVEARMALLQAFQRDGVVDSMEMVARHRSGTVVNGLMSVRALRIDGEDCFLFTYRDITEHKRMQAEAARAQNEKAAAEAANRAKTDFLSRMSHELRTPLNAVLGFSQLLMSDRAERLSERQTTQLEVIQQAGWHLLALINDVLDVSRIEAGRLNLSARPIALTELLDEVVTLVLPQAQRWGVTIATDYRARPPLMVNSDPVRMRQIMLNVITNAVKYNRAGGTAHVDVSQQAQRARVTVADTGLGMTRDQLEHLFEPFNRLGRERSGIEGTGIGMALTRQLLQLMDGTIEVRSEAGVGTQVLIGFPAAAASAAEPRSAASGNDARPTSALPAATRCKGTVLYIEDNPVNQTVVQQMLARWPDLRLVLAGNGERGIALARELRPDLVLLDMRLPDLNGCQVLDALRGDPQTRELAVVALSASAMPEEVAAARASGALEYWTKPLDLAGFLAGVQRLLAPAVA